MSAPARFVCSAALLVLGCAADPSDVARRSAAIVGGAPTTGDDAVMMLVSYPPDHSTFDACTASLVSADVLLTAAHCVDPGAHPDYGFGLFVGPDASAYTTAATLIPRLADVTEVHAHPDYDPEPPFHADVGVAILAEPLDTEPLAIGREPLDDGVVGRPARIVGYGQTRYGEPGAVRHEAATVVASLGDDDTVMVGDLDHRSCIGDSGGPALVEIDGAERIVGVDSYTELSGCLEPAHYRRTDRYVDFLEPFVPRPPDDGLGDAGTDADATDDGGGGGGGDSGCAIVAPAAAGPRLGWLALLAAATVLRVTERRSTRRKSRNRHSSRH